MPSLYELQQTVLKDVPPILSDREAQCMVDAASERPFDGMQIDGMQRLIDSIENGPPQPENIYALAARLEANEAKCWTHIPEFKDTEAHYELHDAVELLANRVRELEAEMIKEGMWDLTRHPTLKFKD